MTDCEKALLTALMREQERSARLEEEPQKAESSRDWAYDRLAEIKAQEVRDE